jgi:hypothetical protein
MKFKLIFIVYFKPYQWFWFLELSWMLNTDRFSTRKAKTAFNLMASCVMRLPSFNISLQRYSDMVFSFLQQSEIDNVMKVRLQK